ncbi:MAG: T9SS C-terminal target domain-containing protein [Flavobacterium sp.]|nr:MAG: T9SS C-terminal target domain-containing protein [Flavobacterium sp.]
MKKIFTTILTVCSVFVINAQLTSRSWTSQFSGQIGGVNTSPEFPANMIFTGDPSSSSIYCFGAFFGATTWALVSSPSIDVLTVMGTGPGGVINDQNDRGMNFWFGPIPQWSQSASQTIKVKYSPWIKVRVANNLSNAHVIKLGFNKQGALNDPMAFSNDITLPGNSIGDYLVSVSGAYGNTLADNASAVTLVSVTNGVAVNLTFHSVRAGIVDGTLESLSISGASTVSASTSSTFEDVPFPGYTGYTISWSSSNTSAATVNASSGVVSGVAPGTTTITATAIQGATTITSEKLVTVINVLPTSVSVTGASTISNVSQYSASILPSNAVQSVTWSVAPVGSAVIDESGKLLPVENGVVTVTATSIADPNIKGNVIVTISNQISPIAENGYIFNNFRNTTFSGMTYAAFGTTTVTGGTNGNPLVFAVRTSVGAGFGSGTNDGRTDGQSGKENHVTIEFTRSTANLFTGSSARVTLSTYSSQAVRLTVYATNGNMFAGTIDRSVNIPAGVSINTIDFSGLTATGFSWGSDVKILIGYNNWTSTPLPAGQVTFTGIEFGTPLTGFVITTTGVDPIINTREGTVNISALTTPAGAPAGFTYTVTSNPIINVATYNDVSSQLMADGKSNGTVTIAATSTVYPYITSSIVVTVTGNATVAPTALGVTLLVPTLGRNGTTTAVDAVSPAGADGSISWSSSDVTRATVNASTGLVTVRSTAAAGTVDIIGTWILANVATVTGSATLTVTVSGSTGGGSTGCTLTGFDVTVTGTAPNYTLSGINPEGCTVLGSVMWSLEPAIVATVNSTTGVISVLTSGVVTITAMSGGATETYLLTIPGNTTLPGTAVSGTIESSSVKLFPNPASSELNVLIEGSDLVSVSLVSSTGQVAASSTSSKLSLSGVAKGFYIVTVQTTKGLIRKSLIVE